MGFDEMPDDAAAIRLRTHPHTQTPAASDHSITHALAETRHAALRTLRGPINDSATSQADVT